MLAPATSDDRLAIAGRELHRLPRAAISTSELDLAAIARMLGATTVRAKRTVERLVTKHLSA